MEHPSENFEVMQANFNFFPPDIFSKGFGLGLMNRYSSLCGAADFVLAVIISSSVDPERILHPGDLMFLECTCSQLSLFYFDFLVFCHRLRYQFCVWYNYAHRQNAQQSYHMKGGLARVRDERPSNFAIYHKLRLISGIILKMKSRLAWNLVI